MATTGLVTEAARDDELFGFCLATGGPGELVCLDSFYVGNLKGVGKVYQLTAIDVFTRWAFVTIVLGPVDRHPHHPLHRPAPAALPTPRGEGAKPCSPTTGPNTWPRTFRAHLAAKQLDTTADPSPVAQPQRRL